MLLSTIHIYFIEPHFGVAYIGVYFITTFCIIYPNLPPSPCSTPFGLKLLNGFISERREDSDKQSRVIIFCTCNSVC